MDSNPNNTPLAGGEDNATPNTKPIELVPKPCSVKLSPRRQRFVEEYCIDLNATKAAIRAGYSIESAKQEGSRLLSFADIQHAICEELLARTSQTRITTAKVIRELSLIALASRSDFKFGENGEILLANESVDPAAIRAVQSHRIRKRILVRKSAEGEELERETLECDAEIKLYDKNKALVTLMQFLGALKLPTPAKEEDPVNELLRKLSPEDAAEARCLLSGASEGRGFPDADSEQPEQSEDTHGV